MSRAQSERALAVDSLAAAGPDAPTLCEGWDTHDLAAHLWVRENDPVAAAGIRVPALAAVTRSRMDEVRSWLSYPELLAAVRSGPPRLSLFGLPGADGLLNTAEFFVHGEDVRRANPQLPPHPDDPGLEEAAWRQLPVMSRLRFRPAGVGVLLERADRVAEPARVLPGSTIVTVVGRPTDLLLYLYGRRQAARVQVVGSPSALAAFEGLSLRI